MGCQFSCSRIQDFEEEWWSEQTLYGRDLDINCHEVDISHFDLSEKVIGVGGFGYVRIARKKCGDDQGKYYALKILSKKKILGRSGGTSVVMNEMESQILVKGCKFICNLHYAFQDELNLFMVLDLAQAGDMRFNLKNIKSGKFDENTVKFYFVQLALALDFCHSRRILHRDIKPENIVMTSKGYLKLTDFGISKILENIDCCTSTSGTHGYMAPEIYFPGHVHGRASDWFSLGVTIFEFLFGRRPFEAFRLQSFKYGFNDDLDIVFPERNCQITDECKLFLRHMLETHSWRRLGCNGISDIQEQLWASSGPWKEAICGNMDPNYVPKISCLDSREIINMGNIEPIGKSERQISSIRAEDQEKFRYFFFRNGQDYYDDKAVGVFDGAKEDLRIVIAEKEEYKEDFSSHEKLNQGIVLWRDLSSLMEDKEKFGQLGKMEHEKCYSSSSIIYSSPTPR